MLPISNVELQRRGFVSLPVGGERFFTLPNANQVEKCEAQHLSTTKGDLHSKRFIISQRTRSSTTLLVAKHLGVAAMLLGPVFSRFRRHR
jgi:hypothetical protein